MAAVGVVAVVVASGVVVAGRSPAPPVVPIGIDLAGRLDDATGRTSTVTPPTDLVQLWDVPLVPEPGGNGTALVAAVVDDDVAIVGDRLLSLVDGRIVGASRDLLRYPWRGADGPGDTVGWVTGGRLSLVDTLTGEVVESVELTDESLDRAIVTAITDDTAVVTDWGFGERGPVTAAVDLDSGDLRWRLPMEMWQPVGDGWVRGWDARIADVGQGGVVLVDIATGIVRRPPDEPAARGVSVAGVVDGTAFGSTGDEVWAWDVRSRDVLWRHGAGRRIVDLRVTDEGLQLVATGVSGPGLGPVSVEWLDRVDGSVLDGSDLAGEVREDVTGGRPQIASADGFVVAVVADGVQVVARGGQGWSRPLEDVLAVAALDIEDGRVAVFTGTMLEEGRQWQGRLLGDTTVTVFDSSGAEQFVAPVRPIDVRPRGEVTAVVDDHVLIRHERGLRLPEVEAVAVRDGGRTGAVGLVATHSGSGGDDAIAVAQSALVLGTLAGGPGQGGVGPLLWRPDQDTVGPAADGVSVEGATSTPMVAAGRLAVRTTDGTELISLPSPGDGMPVDAAVGRAVGVPPVASGETVRPEPTTRITVPGVTPLAGLPSVLLATERSGEPVDGAQGTSDTDLDGQLVVAVDPVDGRLLWRSDVRVQPPDDAPSAPWAGARELSARVAGRTVLAASDGPIVVVGGDEVVGIDRADGRRRWTTPVDGNEPVGGVLLDDAVAVATPAGVTVLDRRTGRQRWAVDLGDLVTEITAAGGTTLVGTATGDVVLLGEVGDEVRRLYATPARVDDVAVIGDRVVVVHGDGTVVGFAPRGTVADEPDGVEVPERVTGP